VRAILCVTRCCVLYDSNRQPLPAVPRGYNQHLTPLRRASTCHRQAHLLMEARAVDVCNQLTLLNEFLYFPSRTDEGGNEAVVHANVGAPVLMQHASIALAALLLIAVVAHCGGAGAGATPQPIPIWGSTVWGSTSFETVQAALSGLRPAFWTNPPAV
jgi:hypothetical protein